MTELTEIPNLQSTEKPGVDKETVQPVELELPLKLLNQLNEETTKHAQEDSGEFWVFILKSADEETISVPVGIGHSWGVSANPNMVVNQLRPHVNQGYRVVADYHNHPNESISVYKEAGFPEVFATSPSTADLNCDERSVRGKVISELDQEPYPRIIAAYSQDTQKVVLNTFNILREPTDAEAKEIEFDEPNFVEEEPDELGIQMLASKYIDPSKLDKLGIVSPLTIRGINEDGSVVEVQNDLEKVVSAFKAGR